MERRCGTCKHYDADLDKRGRRILRANISYRCKAEMPDFGVVERRLASLVIDNPYKSRMLPHHGKNCESWEAWK